MVYLPNLLVDLKMIFRSDCMISGTGIPVPLRFSLILDEPILIGYEAVKKYSINKSFFLL